MSMEITVRLYNLFNLISLHKNMGLLLKNICIIILLGVYTLTFAQNKIVYAKHFTKKNELLLRWAPANKQVFEIAIKI